MEAPAQPRTRAPRNVRWPPRAEHVGSLKRPARLIAAVQEVYEPGHTAMLEQERGRDLSELRRVEDELIREAVAKQRAAGLDVVSDGEFRRVLFTNSFYDAVDGLGPSAEPVLFHDSQGCNVRFAGLPTIEKRLRKVDSPAKREAEFLSDVTDAPFKITFPAGSWWCAPHVAGPLRTLKGYDSPEEFTAHAIELQRGLMAEAIDAGACYIQLDSPPYVWLGDPVLRGEVLPKLGYDLDALLDRFVEADNAILEGLPEDVQYGFHLCRGNFRSRWMMGGSIEPYAERLFNELPYDSFLIEWEDTGREGDYSPLRFVPKGPTVVMGIVSSKDPRVESDDEIVRRLADASRYLDLEQLALSPQCGFASALEGNDLGEDDQWRKLEAIGRVADRLWGGG
jgi:5-methyltetrahydropteroyltriglutamate--homocysteine methyltransferase